MCGWYFCVLGRRTNPGSIFVNVWFYKKKKKKSRDFFLKEHIALCGLLKTCLSVTCSFLSAEISFAWHTGETCLELYPVPVTYLYKKRLCKFSVVGIRNVNMSELENIMHFLPTFACVFTLLVYNRFGLSSVIRVRAVVQIPFSFSVACFCLPFYFLIEIML